MTRLVEPTEQGRLQGALASLIGMASLFGPALFTQIFAASISIGSDLRAFPGAPFLVAALIILVAMVLAWRTTSSAATAATAPS
jgi:DHA1 family tetracycline resistance protein-like MFS transporter